MIDSRGEKKDAENYPKTQNQPQNKQACLTLNCLAKIPILIQIDDEFVGVVNALKEFKKTIICHIIDIFIIKQESKTNIDKDPDRHGK
ncbi:MAG TPA: hypothetical protein VHL11_18335 [Phototrophicaceae bacterium]|jgi:hypothetical protein|nr:hypothetical protein [Phototrophicaceae bacterium]